MGLEYIAKSAVFAEIKRMGAEVRNWSFSVKYVKADNTVSYKPRVMKVYVGNDNAVINRTVNLCDLSNGRAFKISMDFWILYNDKIIQHDR
jgi:hypothetical protein